MTEQKVCTPPSRQDPPGDLGEETCRAYTLEETTLDRDQAEEMLRTRLLADLDQALDQGEVLRTDWAVEEEDGMLRVTLLAQCREQIGREVPLDPADKREHPPGPGGGRSAMIEQTVSIERMEDAIDIFGSLTRTSAFWNRNWGSGSPAGTTS